MERAEAIAAVRRFIDSGGTDVAQLAQVMEAAQTDPALVDEVTRLLEDAGAGAGPNEPLDIGAHFPEGHGPYDLRWPLMQPHALPVPFAALDPKTQFYVLFNEWTTRHAHGWTAVTAGDADAAEAIFTECVDRAAQLEVGELTARAYEGLQAAAEVRGRPDQALTWSTMAMEARGLRP